MRASVRHGFWMAALLLVVAPHHVSGALFDDLELYYSFDENMFTDTSGFDRTLSVVDIDPATQLSLSADVPAAIGSGGSLDARGTEDFLEALAWTGIAGTADRTVSAWIKTEDQDKTYHLVEWGTNSSGQRWTFRVNSNAGNGTKGGLRVEVQSGFIISEGFLADNEWHHIAATFSDDGSPNVDDVKLYIDGQQSNIPAPTTPNPESMNTMPNMAVSVAGSHVFANRAAEALLDEVAVFSRVLSPQEIMELASGTVLSEAPLPGDVNRDGLVNHADFEIIRLNFFTSATSREQGDLVRDGFIDFLDFRQWKDTAVGGGAKAVPEPAAAGMLLMLLAGFAAHSGQARAVDRRG